MDEILLIILGLVIYFLPSIIILSKEKEKRKRREDGIVALNLFLGWTLIGWIVALIWSLTDPPEQEVNAPEDKYDKLSKLKKLLDENVISQEEYDLEKDKIMKNV